MTVRALLVVAHPRRSSLTFAVAEAFATAASGHGVEFERADLVGEGFDATLRADDEPDWSNPEKVYSVAVQAEIARIARNQATVIVFPVWWWSMPAVLKGWIDRVWNHGFAYGSRAYPQRRVWMLGLAGTTEDAYAKRGYDAAMRTQLEIGVLEYCGVEDRRLEILYGVNEGAAEAALARAASLGEEFASGPHRAR
jgi:NAD(P)H dehydrogenase (quinone)